MFTEIAASLLHDYRMLLEELRQNVGIEKDGRLRH